MKKLHMILAVCLILSVLFPVQMALSASFFSGIPVEEFVTGLAYRCSTWDTQISIDNFVFIENLDGIGKAELDGFILSVDGDEESLPVKEISMYLLEKGRSASKDTVTRQYALIAALENGMPLKKVDLAAESKEVKKNAMNIHEKILDALETHIFDLMLGDDVLCYNGNLYNYYLRYEDGSIILLASLK